MKQASKRSSDTSPDTRRLQSLQREASSKNEISSIVEDLMHELSYAIQDFFRLFDASAFEKLVDRMQQSLGSIVVTGVGKSGIVAKKIAATLSSSGTHALFLPAQDALHGDIGIIRPGDIVLLLSKSGETSELIELCPALRNKGAYLIAVTSTPLASRLSRAADETFSLPHLKELCPFDLAPTTSTLCQLIFGDLLSMTLMRRKGITRDDFILNHPGGRIGKRHLIRVRDLMLTGDEVPKCSPEDLVTDILVELSNKKCGCVCIVDSHQSLQGIFTDGDLRRAIQHSREKALSLSMKELMTKSPRSTQPDILAYQAMLIMEEDPKKPVTVLPVIDENRRLVGMLKMHDILQTGL